MTDRELLEMAAKSAGIEYDADSSKPNPISGVFFGLWLVIQGEPYQGQRRYWNPLTDDGDALRLAVKLSIDVSQAQVDYWDKHSNDPYAATRRAIVRAAAMLGEQS